MFVSALKIARDPDQARRRRLALIAGGLGLIYALGYAVYLWYAEGHGSFDVAVLLVAAGMAVGAFVLALRWRLRRAGLLITVATALSACLIAWTGRGVLAPATIWLVAVPWLATALVHARAGAAATVGSILALVGLYLGRPDALVLPVPGYAPEITLAAYIGVLTYTAALAWSHEQQALAGLARLADSLRQKTALADAHETRFQRLFESASDAVIVAEEGAVALASPSVERMFGYTPAALQGRAIETFVHPDERDRVRRLLGTPALVARMAGQRAVFRIRHRDGSHRWCDCAVSEIAGPRRQLLVSGRDVTEQKRVQHEMERALQEAEKLARLKSALLSNLSHELRTPVTAIYGFSDLLTESTTGESQEMAQIIRRGCVRLSRTLNTLVDFALLEAGEVPVSVRPFALRPVLDDVLADYGPAIAGKGLALTVDVDEAALLTSDPELVRKIVHQLVDNAVKFTHHGTVRLACARDGDEVVLTVADTGIGIPPEHRDEIFRSFVQLSQGVGRRYEGSGLGLAVAARLALLLGGRIALAETPGASGACFTVHLPVAPPPARRQAARRDRAPVA